MSERSLLRRLTLQKCAADLVANPAQQTGQDFAAIASRSALDGTARRTKLSVGRDGITQFVDLDRGNRAEDAQVVGLRTLEGVVKIEKDRSLLRRELLRQLSLAGNQSTKTAQQVGIRFGDTSPGPRRIDSFPQVQAAGGNVLDAIAEYRKNRPNPFVPKKLRAADLKARQAAAKRPAIPDINALKPTGVVPAVNAAQSGGQLLLRRFRPVK